MEGETRTRPVKASAKGTRKRAVSAQDSIPAGVSPRAVVGLGASSGGLDALRAFFAEMPADAAIAHVVVQHMVAEGPSLLPELLAKATAMPVVTATDGMCLMGDRVHVVPPGKCLSLIGDEIRVEEMREGGALPIDHFFRSLAEARDERGVAIVLSGTATDGTLGLRAVKEHGGLTLAQDPGSAKQAGMPRSAIRSGAVDAVLAPGLMPEVILRWVRDLIAEPLVHEPVLAILNFIRARIRHDFRQYKKGTVLRRIQRRMALRAIDSTTAYLSVLHHEPDELELLHRDLLIGVTRFFRDPAAFEALDALVLQPRIAGRGSEEPLRIWAPGCSTGEEAYSLAIAVTEAAARAGREVSFKIFATDADARALETARAGIYAAGIVGDLGPDRTKRFFSPVAGGWHVQQSLRESIVFAEQNLLGDPPFHKLDLIVCRNLMIYLEPTLQRRVLSLFHFALKPGGALFLGPSESIGGREDLYEPLSKKWRLFRRVDGATPGEFPVGTMAPAVPSSRAGARPAAAHDLAALVHGELLAEFAPAAVLVNDRLEVQYFHGEVGRFLTFPAGRTTYDLATMCPAGVRAKLRALIGQARGQRGLQRLLLRWADDSGPAFVALTAKAVSTGGLPGFLLAFAEADGVPGAAGPGLDGEPAATVVQLEAELRQAREELKGQSEEMETANEELRASNEEMMSMNEELQATNEELETTKEELQALNEELTTVNQELNEKLRELEDTNNDLINFLTSTDTATIFLDLELRIRRFTPATRALLNLLPTDVGRPLADLVGGIGDGTLLADAAAVIRDLAPVEQEVRAANDAWYLRRIIAYRTRDHRIDGVVVTFTNISHSKATDAARAERERRGHLAMAEAQAAELSAANLRLRELDGRPPA